MAQAAKTEVSMRTGTLAIHDELASLRRLAVVSQRREGIAAWELAVLFGMGVIAALLNAYLKTRTGIPGSSIILTVLPMALGTALVPRKGSGSIIGISSIVSMLVLQKTGFGALSCMLATGVLLDLALRHARDGFRLYIAFIVAGLGGNAIAYLVRGIGKISGLDAGSVPLSAWWAHALVSYALCGALAGLISAAMWFQFGARSGRR
jgi:hypothetical protein